MVQWRKWTTPLLSGMFLLSAATGILMFLHAASPLARGAHEWLSWGLVAAAGLHLAINARALWQALKPPLARAALGAFALATLVAGALPARQSAELDPGAMRVVARAAVDAPLPSLAAMLDAPPSELRRKLEARGLKVPAETSSMREIALANGGQTRPVMEALFE